MRVQDQVKFCGTVEHNGVMTDVYDTSKGTRLVDGIIARDELDEHELREFINDPGTVVLDWR